MELTGPAKWSHNYRTWLAGAAFSNSKFGGGVGNIAYKSSENVQTLKDFKQATRTRINDVTKI